MHKNSFIYSNFCFFLFLIILSNIQISKQLTIGEFTIDNINELRNGKGGKFFPSFSPLNEYFQLCVFNDQEGEGSWGYAPTVNISDICYNKVLNKKSGASEILIYKFFRIRNSTELEPGNIKAGITKIYEVFYQFIYYINGDIDENSQIDIGDICEESIILYYKPTVSSTLKTTYFTVSQQNPKTNPELDDLDDYDIFNPNSNFYTSVCAIYTYNTYLENFILKETKLKYFDLSLEMRKLYFPGATELCPLTCDYIGINKIENDLLVVCKCDDQHFDLLGGTVPKSQTFSSIYYDDIQFNQTNKDNYFSIEVIKCFQNTMKNAFNNNYGSYITLSIGVIIIFAFAAIFIWGKGRIISIFELLYNNNINSLNQFNNQEESNYNYNKIYDNSEVLTNFKDNNVTHINSRNKNSELISNASSRRGINIKANFIKNSLMKQNNVNNQIYNDKINNNLIEPNKEKIKNHEKNENGDNEEYEEFEDEYEEEEDDELANPPRKIIVKKKKKKLIKNKNKFESLDFDYSLSPKNNQHSDEKEMKFYENSQNEEQSIEGNYNNIRGNSKKINNNINKNDNERKIEERRKIISELQNQANQNQKKRPIKVTKDESEETSEENNYLPDIQKTKICVPVDNIFTDQELNYMDLEAIYQYDKRSFIEIYLSILNKKCPIFFMFTYYNSNKGISLPLQIKYPGIKLIFFCIIIYICFFFNATVFGSKSITFAIKGTYGIGKNIAFAAILAPFCLIIRGIIYFLIFYEVSHKISEIKIKLFTSLLIYKGQEEHDINFKSILEEKEEEDNHKNQVNGDDNFNEEEIVKKDIREERLKLKYQILDLFNFIKNRAIISMACLIVIIIFIWYYIAAFCACYRNTQVIFLLNVFLTFIFCNIIPCLYSFLPAYFRKLAFDKQDNKLFVCYQILQII